MRIIKNILKANAGKVALSAMQTLGIATGVAVAGVGAYFALGSSSDVNPDTVFSSYNDGDVVYVAGHSAGGGYAGVGGAPVEGGEIKSGFQAKLSHSLRLMNEETNKPEILEVEAQEQSISAYAMDGNTSGLGVGAGQQGANEKGLPMGGDMSAIQAQIAALQANVKAQQQAAADAAAGAEGKNGEALAATKSGPQGGANGDKLGGASGISTGGGHNLGAQGLQPGSYQGSGAGAKPKEGQPIQSALKPTPTRAALFAGGRPDINVGTGGGALNANSLYAMAKQSAHFANSGLDASEMFLAGPVEGSGISFSGGNVTTGLDTNSHDYGADNVPNIDAQAADTVSYEEAREDLRKKIQKFVISCNRWSIWGSIVPILGTGLGYAFKAQKRDDMLEEIKKFKEEWGDTNFEKLNSQGGYATVSEGVVQDAFRGIFGANRPKRKAKEWGREYWNSEDAFIEEDPKDLGSPDIALGDIPTSPYKSGSSYTDGELDIGSGYGSGSY